VFDRIRIGGDGLACQGRMSRPGQDRAHKTPRCILGNGTWQEHGAKVSTITRRFHFHFTPTHGSWLNLEVGQTGPMSPTARRPRREPDDTARKPTRVQ